MYQSKLAFIGGDMRSCAMAQRLADRGFCVSAWGFSDELFPKCAVSASSLAEALERAEAVVLPMPAFGVGEEVSFVANGGVQANALFDAVGGCIPVFGGRISREIALLAERHGVRLLDYSTSEELQVRNAIPTAEGAIMLVMQAMDVTIHGSRMAVLGYGRIGELLSRRLSALGAHVSVAARKRRDIARIEANACQGIDLSVPDALEVLAREPFDAVFNTVPHRLISNELLSRLPSRTVLVELASAPGGWDAQAEHGCRTIYAPGLPAKYAPKTAGELLADALITLWKEEAKT